MTLIKTSFLSAIAVVVKMLTLLGINKVLAVYVGPSGYAVIGQFQNAVQIITTLGTGAINAGVTKYTAENHNDVKQQHIIWQTAGTLVFIFSIFSGILISFLSEFLARYFLNDSNLQGVFVWFSSALVFFAFNTLILAIINGKKEVELYVKVNICGSLFAFVVTGYLSVKYELYGALVSLSVYQSLSFFVTYYLCKQKDWFEIRYLVGRVDKSIALKLSKFAVMALTTAICVPVSHLFIREDLSFTFGNEYAGYWEAMWRLSSAFFMLITTTLTVYFLPKFSELSGFLSIKAELKKGYCFILPITLIGCAIMYFYKSVIIELLFTSDFGPMEELFFFQVIGNFFQMASWVLGVLMLSKAKFKIYIFVQIFFSFLFVVLSALCVDWLGFSGVALSHAINYVLCFVFLLYSFYWLKDEY